MWAQEYRWLLDKGGRGAACFFLGGGAPLVMDLRSDGFECRGPVRRVGMQHG